MSNQSPSMEQSSPEPSAVRPQKYRFGFSQIFFLLFMAALTFLFVSLGNWQVQRLDEKTNILADIASRADLESTPIPPIAEWSVTDPEIMSYLPVSVTGVFDHDKTVLVFTSLVNPRGVYSGPGYWVFAPLLVEDTGIIFVNRGFIPQQLQAEFRVGGGGPSGQVKIEGLARKSGRTNDFTPNFDRDLRIDYVRNIDRLIELSQTQQFEIAPFYIDSVAGVPSALPQGGETRLTLTNKHFEYAITWFALAIVTPLMLLVWLWGERKKSKTVRQTS